MAKKTQKQQKKQETVKTSPQKTETKATTNELLIKLASLLKQEGAVGYVCGVVGADAKILPYVGAASIGDLLTIKYVVEKEINRLIDSTTKTSSEAPAASAQ
jgi:hypothetical protein